MCGRQTTTLSQQTEINSIYEILYHRIENLARNLKKFFKEVLFIMEIKEKVKKVYQKLGINLDNEILNEILQDEEKTRGIIRIYKQEEIKSMNYILGKDENNSYFSKEELEFLGRIDLFNRTVIKWCKLIWDNRDNEENLNEILKALKEGRCPKCA